MDDVTTSIARAYDAEPQEAVLRGRFDNAVLPRFNIDDIPVTEGHIRRTTATTQTTTQADEQRDGKQQQDGNGTRDGMTPPRPLTAEERFAYWQDMYGKTVTIQTPQGPKDVVVEPVFTPENLGPTHTGQAFAFEGWMSWLYRNEDQQPVIGTPTVTFNMSPFGKV